MGLFNSQSNHLFPPVSHQVNRNICHLRRGQSPDPLVRAKVIVIDLHPSHKLLRSDGAVKASKDLGSLPEGSVQPFKDVIIRLLLEARLSRT